MGEMAELALWSHYDIDYFDSGAEDYCRSWGRNHNIDPLYYSRRIAVCAMCETDYDDLCRSVSETAANARKDGWQIERNGDQYDWFCPNCKAAHDFEGIAKDEDAQ